MASLKLENVKKIYGSNVIAVNDFNLDIEDKEFIVFVGPSGCGKSTTLRMIAGLEDISEGTIKIDDMVVNDLQPKDRDIAMVFQNYALYPHLSVFENIAFSLRLKKVKNDIVYEKVTGVTYHKVESASGTCAGSTVDINATFTGTEGDIAVTGKANDYAVKTAEFTGGAIELAVGDIVVAAQDVTVS